MERIEEYEAAPKIPEGELGLHYAEPEGWAMKIPGGDGELGLTVTRAELLKMFLWLYEQSHKEESK